LESTVSQQLFPTRPQGLTFRPVERMHHLLEEIELADKVGLDVLANIIGRNSSIQHRL
jgi:hypothetical protein